MMGLDSMITDLVCVDVLLRFKATATKFTDVRMLTRRARPIFERFIDESATQVCDIMKSHLSSSQLSMHLFEQKVDVPAQLREELSLATCRPVYETFDFLLVLLLSRLQVCIRLTLIIPQLKPCFRSLCGLSTWTLI